MGVKDMRHSSTSLNYKENLVGSLRARLDHL